MSAYVAETPTGEAVAQRGGDAGSVARAEGCRQPCLPSLADSGLSYSVSTSARARSVVPVVRYPPAVDLAVSDPASLAGHLENPRFEKSAFVKSGSCIINLPRNRGFSRCPAGGIDSDGIERIHHPIREGRSPRQIGRKDPPTIAGSSGTSCTCWQSRGGIVGELRASAYMHDTIVSVLDLGLSRSDADLGWHWV